MPDTFYITKYALIEGILSIRGNISSKFPTMVEGEGHYYFHGDGREWHRTMDAAIAKAENMRKAKIASLLKQISKLEQLSFISPKTP